MAMNLIWTGMLLLSLIAAIYTGRGSQLSAAIQQGAQTGFSLMLSLAGSICLWTGVGHFMEKTGITAILAKLLRPGLQRLFPSSRTDRQLAQNLSSNICANLLGLGNAATPMGIRAAQRLSRHAQGIAGDELCRLIVLNTASIQLLPTNVAALRASLGYPHPFDILPAVWITSFLSAGVGLTAAWILGKLWK